MHFSCSCHCMLLRFPACNSVFWRFYRDSLILWNALLLLKHFWHLIWVIFVILLTELICVHVHMCMYVCVYKHAYVWMCDLIHGESERGEEQKLACMFFFQFILSGNVLYISFHTKSPHNLFMCYSWTKSCHSYNPILEISYVNMYIPYIHWSNLMPLVQVWGPHESIVHSCVMCMCKAI